MRELTDNARGQKNARSAAPRYILAIEWGGETGTRFYSDVALGNGTSSSVLNAEGRVASWGSLSAAITESTSNPMGDLTIELLDADQALLAIVQAVEPQRKRAAIYAHFEGLEEADLVPLLRGIVNHPVAWREAEGTLQLDLTDISAWFQRTIGTLASVELFPEIAPEDVGKCLPLVYGKCRRVPGVHVAQGSATALWRTMLGADMVFYADRDGFPEGEEVYLWVEDELMRGTWTGNTFTAVERGIKMLRSRTTEAGDYNVLIDSTLPHIRDHEYVGYCLRIRTPDGTHFPGAASPGGEQYRRIMASSVDADCIWYGPSFTDGDGFVWLPPKGTPYEITSYRTIHYAGAPVRHHLAAGYVYILNDAPSAAVDFVEVWGTIAEARPGPLGTAPDFQKIEGWCRIDPEQYVLNLNDTSSFPGLGHAVTTVTFSRNPAELKPSWSDRLVAQVRGVESAGDGSGTAFENPADIIKAIANRQMGLVDGTDLDTASFADAQAKLGYLKMAFAIQEARDALDLLADLAVQCRSQCVWEAGKLALRVLPYATPAAVATLSKAVIAADSLERTHTPLDEVVTEYLGTFRPTCADDEQQVVARSAEAEAAYGRRVDEMSLWAYQRAGYATAILEFWLKRRSQIYEDITVETMLTSLELERLDAVELDWPGQFDEGQRAQVIAIDHAPGSGDGGQIDTIRLTLRAPVGDDSCETQDQDPVIEDCGETCETDCQDPAELFCTGACDGSCTSYCTIRDCNVAEAGCDDACESEGCESGAESECGGEESDCGDCEFFDESGCGDIENDCRQCITSCVSSCIAGGAEPCQTSAEEGCATCCRTYSCQTACRCSGQESEECTQESDCGSIETCGESCQFFDESDCGAIETCGESCEYFAESDECTFCETYGIEPECGQCEIVGVESDCGSCETSGAETACGVCQVQGQETNPCQSLESYECFMTCESQGCEQLWEICGNCQVWQQV